MQKLIPTLLFLLCITGCKQKLLINGTINEISYDNNIIQKEDYSAIMEKISNLNFYCGKNKHLDGKKLSIKTTTNIINFVLSDSSYLEYQNDDEFCYTEDVPKTNDLYLILTNILNKYNDTSWFSINYIESYTEINEDINIRLDKDNKYVVLNLSESVTNLRINELSFDNSEEINLIYIQEYLDPTKIVIRQNIKTGFNYKITFNNKYGKTFSITPQYNETTEEITFDVKIK